MQEKTTMLIARQAINCLYDWVKNMVKSGTVNSNNAM